MKILLPVALVFFCNTGFGARVDTLTVSRNLRIAERLASTQTHSTLSLSSKAYSYALHLETDTLAAKALKITCHIYL
jgi:hypothetical protein